IGVVSQPYNLYDSYASMDLLKLLRKRGVKVLTPENLPSRVIAARVETLPKQLFWSMGRRLLGSGLHFLERQDVDGVIHLASFGCGPDSFTGELIEREFRRRGGGRFLNLTVDEHTGEAGLVTRIEAFLDMLQRRVACE
ncbi:MAG TPA: 2-hydroxyacyl-CoA dehydratase, partial [Bacillota bacterium]|nr:2-hydroxyacyl-CoA dehydratase [Bacillota bacterium]